MALDELVKVQLDTLELRLRDAFYRLKTSSPYTLIEATHISNKYNLLWRSQEAKATTLSTLTYNKDRASMTLGLPATVNERLIYQSTLRSHYQPGKAQEAIFTNVTTIPGAGIKKRGGYFDRDSGTFFETDADNISTVVRSSLGGISIGNRVDDAKIRGDSWFDPINGNGRSGKNLDQANVQIPFVALEWLGAGSVIFGFFLDAEPVICDIRNNANVIDSVYMGNPNLPIRYELENDGTGGVSSLEVICATVIAWGGLEQSGVPVVADRYRTPFTTANSANLFPVMSMRIKPGEDSAVVFPQRFNLFTDAEGDPFYYKFVINPTIVAGGESWVDIPDTSMQYDISRDNTKLITPASGFTLTSGYVPGGATAQGQAVSGSAAGFQLSSFFSIGSGINYYNAANTPIDGTPDELVLGVSPIPTGVLDMYASITLREF